MTGTKKGELTLRIRLVVRRLTVSHSPTGLAAQARAVAVAIPYCINEDKRIDICLVSSRKHAHAFVLPKGGIEEGETSRQAAVREMWEEAGLRPLEPLPTPPHRNRRGAADGNNVVEDHKAHKHSPVMDAGHPGFVPRARYEAHEIAIRRGDPASELAQWPEDEERQRRWVEVHEALDLIAWRKDIHTLLLHSSLMRSTGEETMP